LISINSYPGTLPRWLACPAASRLYFAPASITLDPAWDTIFSTIYIPIGISVGRVSYQVDSIVIPAPNQQVSIGVYSIDGLNRLLLASGPATVGQHTLSAETGFQAGLYFVGAAVNAGRIDIEAWSYSLEPPLDDGVPAGKPVFTGSLTGAGGVLPTSFNPLDLFGNNLCPALRFDS